MRQWSSVMGRLTDCLARGLHESTETLEQGGCIDSETVFRCFAVTSPLIGPSFQRVFWRHLHVNDRSTLRLLP